jgi:hypothetical protein
MTLRAAYERTSQFLSTCTESVTPTDFRFIFGRAGVRPERWKEAELHRRFGEGDSIDIHPDRVDDALNFLEEIGPQPNNDLGNIWFTVNARFHIIDPDTGKPLPGQNPDRYGGVEYQWDDPLGTSRLTLNLHSRASLAIDLCIPDADDERLARVIPWLQANLPCKLSPKHWMQWTPTKTGSFKGRKIPSPPTR